MPISTYRYQLLAYKGGPTRLECPGCGHHRSFVPYVDKKTGELLPDAYGRCNREDKCTYHLSPYHKTDSGMTYADQVYEYEQQQWIDQNGGRSKPTFKPVIRSNYVAPRPIESTPIIAIPDELFEQSLGHYERNQLAYLLRRYFGIGVANELLVRFNIGTSSFWPGACVFWYIDESGQKRGGQIKLFDDSFHTAKYVGRDGHTRSQTSWVHTAYARRCDQKKQPYPTWLTNYMDERNSVQKSPCLFGLPQLRTAPDRMPVAIVEAPKTAIICTPYLPEFVWMAVGSLSYLNAERLESVKARKLVLFPDLSEDSRAFNAWRQKADQLCELGFVVEVSGMVEEFVEKMPANERESRRQKGWDIADFLIDEWKGYPPSWD